ncbi:YgfZ/GcvT domain-containing protein [Alkalimarinus coralli]|uniref:CAF17-like 4Fe-4S cluster assembly/insertion protein YgfZ n=1 Tax=Alkalimarinus coralli TaxID=2935863 RepID=UPI00202ACECA|nr:hypothetical protein [Alkalimarinus coralli]
MSTHFINWLNESGYPVENQHANNTKDIESAHFIAPLTDYSIIRVSGADAEKFMQGQFSCDVREVKSDQSRMGSANTPKGRAYATFRIAKQGDDYLLRLPTQISQDVCERLNKYIVFSKATLALDENLCVLGLSGSPQSLSNLLDDTTQLPAEVDNSISIGRSTIIRVPSHHTPRYEIWCEPDTAKSLLTDHAEGRQNTQYTQADWAWTEIAEGIAEIYSETQESYIPQMLNLQHLNAISFKKGCYTGQEIIARMKYLGKLKKGMFLLSASRQPEALPNADIFEQSTGKKVGSVVRSISANDQDTQRLLAVLDIETGKSKSPLTLTKATTQDVNYLNLPYTSDNV